MRTINFITNLDQNTTSGGWGGINYNIFKELRSYCDVNYIGPINPDHINSEKRNNKILRLLAQKSKFSFFSDKRLALISKSLESKIMPSDYNFFFGQTSWINYHSPAVPYGTYLDADFKTYLDIFSEPNNFSVKDIERIQKKEEYWLQNAKDIFIGSEWAWKEMIKYYDLKESQKHVVFTGGNIALPSSDNYRGGLNFVFISLNFAKKGGYICVDAFKKIKEFEPTATLSIIGQRPPDKVIAASGIDYVGLLNKNSASDMAIFETILSEAFLLVHPTKMDTMGAVLIEAGYYGCPSIAPRSFGVPELVLNNKTGLIVEVPFTSDDFASRIIKLIRDKKVYQKMRQNAFDHTQSNLTWQSVGKSIANQILK